MNREEYLRRLSYLLQDLPEEEYKDALEYYEDYFEEAGPDREQEVIRELGRPERIAAMIRDSVKEKDGDWEYTENGYYNKRYDDHNQMPGQTEKKMKEGKERESWHMKGSRNRNIILLVIILVLASGAVIPAALGLVLGIGGGVVGFAGGILGIGAACAPCIGLLIGGIVVVISGIVKMFTVAPTGMLLLGCGCLMAAAGLLLLMLAVWIIGGVLPKLIRWIVGIFRKLFHRGGEGV